MTYYLIHTTYHPLTSHHVLLTTLWSPSVIASAPSRHERNSDMNTGAIVHPKSRGQACKLKHYNSPRPNPLSLLPTAGPGPHCQRQSLHAAELRRFLWGRRHPEIPGDSGDLLWKLVFRAFWEPRLSKRLDMESEPALEPKCLQYIHVILHQVILSYCEAIVWGCLHPPCTEPHDWRIEPLHR